MANDPVPVVIESDRLRLDALLGIPDDPTGLVIFAHGSGSGRFSPRNNHVAAALRQAGFATLLLDLLRPEEERDRANVFDIGLLAHRLVIAAEWAERQPRLVGLPIGLFGASTGAGAALVAAASAPDLIAAVVSRGGRPDLADAALAEVRVPVLLIVGGDDAPVISLNEQALGRLAGEKKMVIVSGAGHLFEEAGTLDTVIDLATHWFIRKLVHERAQ